MAASVTATGPGAAPPASLSRYRSKRRTQAQPIQEPATPAIPSRYRHRSASLTRQSSAQEFASDAPPVPPLPLGNLSNHLPITRSADPLLTGAPKTNTFEPSERIDEDEEMVRPKTKDSGKSFRGDDRMAPARWVDAPTSFGASGPELKSPKSRRSPTIFSFFSRKKEDTMSPPVSVPTSPLGSREGFSRGIEPGGKGIVPQVDAPTSASNAGDRRVMVRCGDSSITLPVSTDTTPTSILHSAANLITHKINPETSLLLESYQQYGLERRLRRYERVRDVMNSWDRDALNALVVIPSDMPENDRDLSLGPVPRTPEAPYEFCLQMYHCPRVGKWNKRYITLNPSGQIFASKKNGVALGDKDALSLCHLSDFDVYSPTEHQIKKVLKPPKRFCYAVKSQQKSSVFPTGENFVHFFCTDDGALAERFQGGVHGWRSWYLVNRKTDLQELQGIASKGPSRRTSTRDGKGAEEDKPYAIGSFKPLLDMEAFNKSYDEPRQRTRELQDIQRPPNNEQRRAGPPRTQESVQRRLSKGSNGPTGGRAMSMRSRDANIDANGLLGDAYEERKEEQRRREEALRNQPEESPFTGGPSLINNIPAAPYESPPGRDTSVSGRSSSRYRRDASRQRGVRRPSSPGRRPEGLPAPLLDIEGQAAEPTSWREEVSRNRGHGVKAPAGVPLVDLAKGREAAHRFDPTTGTFSRGGGAPGVGALEEGFRGDTLVGKVARSQSTASRGMARSMSTATRRGRMLEEAPPLPANGTLLARIETQKRGRSGVVR